MKFSSVAPIKVDKVEHILQLDAARITVPICKYSKTCICLVDNLQDGPSIAKPIATGYLDPGFRERTYEAAEKLPTPKQDARASSFYIAIHRVLPVVSNQIPTSPESRGPRYVKERRNTMKYDEAKAGWLLRRVELHLSCINQHQQQQKHGYSHISNTYLIYLDTSYIKYQQPKKTNIFKSTQPHFTLLHFQNLLLPKHQHQHQDQITPLAPRSFLKNPPPSRKMGAEHSSPSRSPSNKFHNSTSSSSTHSTCTTSLPLPPTTHIHVPQNPQSRRYISPVPGHPSRKAKKASAIPIPAELLAVPGAPTKRSSRLSTMSMSMSSASRSTSTSRSASASSRRTSVFSTSGSSSAGSVMMASSGRASPALRLAGERYGSESSSSSSSVRGVEALPPIRTGVPFFEEVLVAAEESGSETRRAFGRSVSGVQ
ncbi:hypothetical protein WAI453_010743 [Rhynchosporium graminicola]